MIMHDFVATQKANHPCWVFGMLCRPHDQAAEFLQTITDLLTAFTCTGLPLA